MSEETDGQAHEPIGEIPEAEAPPGLRLALSPSVQEAIARIPELIEKRMEQEASIAQNHLTLQAEATKRATYWILGATVALALIVVLPTALLTNSGKLSPDAATFLFGAIVGASFTFLRDFFPRAD